MTARCPIGADKGSNVTQLGPTQKISLRERQVGTRLLCMIDAAMVGILMLGIP